METREEGKGEMKTEEEGALAVPSKKITANQDLQSQSPNWGGPDPSRKAQS